MMVEPSGFRRQLTHCLEATTTAFIIVFHNNKQNTVQWATTTHIKMFFQ